MLGNLEVDARGGKGREVRRAAAALVAAPRAPLAPICCARRAALRSLWRGRAL